MPIAKPIFLTSKGAAPRGSRFVDALSESREELFVVRHPWFRKEPFKGSGEWKRFLTETEGRAEWVYFPWSRTAVHLLDEELYFELRTARNKDLITKDEQSAYRGLSVGIAGLSVGSSILSALVLTGGPQVLRIADFDVLAPSNMNRIRSSVENLGRPKIELAAREVWGVDPFAKLDLWTKGVSEGTMAKFIAGKPRLDVFIDEMDSLAAKVAARIVAKKERIPVLMATDNGDGVILDVERFDEEPKRKIFHGLVGDLTLAQARRAKGKQWFDIVKKIIGEEHMPQRHRESLARVGKSLAGIPQLGTDALSAGVAVSLAVRKIANGAPLRSGRYILDMEKVLAPRKAMDI